MIGVKFWRMKRKLTRKALAAQSGVSLSCVESMEAGSVWNKAGKNLLRISDTLDVSVDELIRDYPDDALDAGDHFVREAKSIHPDNLLAKFKTARNLDLGQLAELLELKGRESARAACKKPAASEKHIRKLAGVFGLTAEEFCLIYE